MRTVGRSVSTLVVSVCMAVASTQAIAATDDQKPSVDSQLCAFAGVCGDQPATPAVTRDAPETKGFRLARAAPAAPVTEPAPATKGFRLARPQTAEPAPTTKGFRLARPQAAEPAPTTRGFRMAKPAGAAPLRPASTPRVRTAMVTQAQAQPRGAAMAEARRSNLSITFEAGSDRITPEGLESARIFQQTLMAPQLRDKRFVIQGHTDASGNASKNLDLSRRRAQAVADFLISQNIDASRLEVKGLGSAAPLSGHRKSDPANRRVEAELIS